MVHNLINFQRYMDKNKKPFGEIKMLLLCIMSSLMVEWVKPSSIALISVNSFPMAAISMVSCRDSILAVERITFCYEFPDVDALTLWQGASWLTSTTILKNDLEFSLASKG